MEQIGNLFGDRVTRPSPSKKTRETERGEMMRYFIGRLNPGLTADGLPLISMGRMGRLLEKIPTKDLYALKTKCEDAERRGYSFSKKFWWEIKPRPASG